MNARRQEGPIRARKHTAYATGHGSTFQQCSARPPDATQISCTNTQVGGPKFTETYTRAMKAIPKTTKIQLPLIEQ